MIEQSLWIENVTSKKLVNEVKVGPLLQHLSDFSTIFGSGGLSVKPTRLCRKKKREKYVFLFLKFDLEPSNGSIETNLGSIGCILY